MEYLYNHITAAGGVKKAVNKVRGKIPHNLKIEVEVKNLSELKEAMSCKVDIIMLDNMDPKQAKEAAAIVKREMGSSCLVEVSGNINLNNLEDYCKTGIDLISVGYITHSAPAIDFSLEFVSA